MHWREAGNGVAQIADGSVVVTEFEEQDGGRYEFITFTKPVSIKDLPKRIPYIGPNPMPVLKNSRHEAFAQALAKGETATRAYELAGYKPNDGNAARLKGNDRIIARVAAILGKAATRVEITKARVLEELGRIGFANMRDYITLDAQGQPHVDLTALSTDQWAAVQEITVEQLRTEGGEEEGEGTVRVERTKFKLHDKRQALVAIGRHLGMFADKGTGLPANTAPAGSDQPQRLPEEALAEMAGRYRASLRVIEGKANRTDDY